MATDPQPAVQVVWFKRDLRIDDHPPLYEAAQRGPIVPLYIVEPDLMHAPDSDPRHWTFLRASLETLRADLAALGQPLLVRVGDAVRVLEMIRRQVPLAALWAHEETGNEFTYRRDRAVKRWARRSGIPFRETPSNGVVRALKERTGWANLWEQTMRQRVTPVPERLQPVDLHPGRIPDHEQLRLPRTRCDVQPGGSAAAQALLHTFFSERLLHYRAGMASPVTAWESCSRLSPHLAYGTISQRVVVQATRQRIRSLQRGKGIDSAEIDPALRHAALRGLKAFESRVAWRSHFMQKLESEPEIEFHNYVRALDGLREDEFDPARFEAWATGRTGYPLVDAAMRALAATGWINFRMRAMLVSFACYDLWLHWREPALHMARLYVDYEPGIHYPQMQMQAGTSGINTIRRYDPTKQAREQDPTGVFIRRWVPELRDVPDLFLLTPWRMSPSIQRQSGCEIGKTYPAPLVDATVSGPQAVQRVYAARRTPDAIAQTQQVLEKHGSRRPPRNRRKRKAPKNGPIQLTMNLDE